MNMCLVLLSNENYDEISKILSCSALRNLWPSLLIHFLHNLPHIQISIEEEICEKSINICESIHFILNKCSYIRYEYNEPILINLNAYLNCQLTIVKWILKHRKKNAPTVVDQNLSVKHILSGLQNTCTLTVLKKSINIHECDFMEIERLLKDKEQTMTVFKSYQIMQTTLKAILMHELYNAHTKEITENLYSEIESLLNVISPLDLRLEVIENIFSMLFLRYNAHFDVTEGTSEEEDYDTALTEKESQSLAYESRESEKYRHGFICNKYSVNQFLYHLKRCTVQISIDFAKLRQESRITKDLEDLQKSIFNVDKAITDALWRIELLTSLEFIENKDNVEDSFITINDLVKTLDEKHGFNFRLKNKSIFYNEPTGSSSEESKFDKKSDIDLSSDTGSIDTNLNANKFRRKAKNNAPTVELVGVVMKHSNSKLIINLMLASKESLVIQCLWKGNYIKAQEVIEMFNMRNTYLDGQVRFSQAMQNFRQEMMKQIHASDTLDYPIKTKEFQMLENVRRAAQGGYWSSRMTNQLETFVASQESNARLLCSNANGAREILALCVLDLALTTNQNHQPTANLLDVAVKYLKLSLMHEGNLRKSVPKALCDARILLNIQDWKEKTDFWRKLIDKINQFQKSQLLSDKLENMINANGLLTLNGQKVFKDTITLCGNTQSYLYKIQAHLKILYSIVPNDERVECRTETNLLSNSLDFYFGHQIFDLNNEPKNLEIVANKLGVNLVHNILVNCCPKLTFYDSLQTIGNETWGCIVLNKNLNNKDITEQKNQDPNQCVADILLELIETIKYLNPNVSRILNKDLYGLSKNPDIQRILRKSSELEFLDLSELSVGEHTLAFFLNLWNLLFLHTQLTVWITNPPLNSLRHFISQSSISYHVGDLGRISLAILRSKLLGCMSWDNEYFSYTEDLNEVAWQDLDLVHDPRVIFVMANEFYETPIIHIFYPQSLNKDLNLGLRNYLDYYSRKELEYDANNDNANQTKLLVWLPDLVECYEKFETKNISNVNYENGIPIQSYKTIFSSSGNFSKSEEIIYKYKKVVNSFEILLKYEEISVANLDIMIKLNMNSNYYNSPLWMFRSIKSNVLHYLEGHCWLLSYLVKRVHKASSFVFESSCDNLQRTACFENNSTALWMLTLASALFDNNITLATIQENLSLNDLWIYLDKCLKIDQIQNCLDIINALPNRLLARSTEIQCLKDKLLYQLIYKMKINSNTEKILQCIYQIKDINVLAQTILSNINEWPIYLCQDALFYILHHTDKHKLPSHCKFKMNETLCRVTVFYKILPHCKNKELESKKATWHDVIYCTEKTDPVYIIQSLVEANKFELCLEWLEYQAFSLEIQSLVTHDLLIGLLRNDEMDFKNARKLLAALPIRQSIKMCKGVLKKLESIRSMRFIIEYLLEHCEIQKAIMYYKIQIGIEIIDQLEHKERVHYIQLIKEPLLILEQLLMNCKFENLRKIINIIQRSNNFSKANIPIENFDKIVRFYAGKSLDFRVSLQRDGIDSKIKDTTNLISSLDNENHNSEFIMPINVPTKEKWIPNDKARECSSCKGVIFSMFNRRHHCRRCGRVVCAACSQQRMQVLGYPKSMLVRVCDDCKKQTTLQMQTAQGTPSAGSSVILECWKLTTDESHNQTVREEFSFEYAPNISLCLAILNLHSDHKAYASFLLDRCDEMKRLLQPVTGGRVNPEIDHALIIKMIRSLLVAVKVKCAKLGLNAGLAHCDRFLSQVDLIATLVQSDCLALIPSDDSLDEHALRKLRDLLTEKEQWTLALDVSTKSGLDTQGVWAAWGKACLKVGYLDRARTKFSHCLEKVLYENFDDWVLLSYPDTDCVGKSHEDLLEIQKQRKLEIIKNDSPNRKRQPVRNRPIKDPPLLLEILQILENQSQLNSDQSLSTPQLKSNVAQEILITLNSLKTISQGQCSFVRNWNSHSIYYEENLYYLLTYGSFNSILEFFVKHEEFNKCLTFILENNIEPELFFNSVYLRCLNMGNIAKLFAALKADDASLLTWKKYLVYTCHSLDKKQLLNTLYHLQLFMKDFIRAAMTCIRFYKNDARNYIDLSFKSHFLIDAQKHLETELNVENLSKKRRKSACSSLSNSHNGLTMEMEPSEIDKHMNTISRQLEIVKFLGNAEREGRFTGPYLKHLLDMDTEMINSEELPTLFGNHQQKTRLAVLAILCGRDAEEGFGIAFRIMQDYNLRPQKLYSLAGHVLAIEKKIGSIEQLIKCCRSSGAPDSQAISDQVLAHCVKLLLHNHQTVCNSDFKDHIDSLIRLIHDVELKISSYIESKQLKAAYLLAVKYQRTQDIKKILKEADRLGQNAIRSICTKWLKQAQNSM
ncbi:PREDICTED: zinc finger FYVE domain-containing protein 26 [Ceratosolen solmsi marchali]|uniref:Zinc finger FYVE domain-containing protein 26 n=1 Tax=Ceratosolen solmsi marchali TaxID=326594 RepID=A0AAJ7E012_9HYME|nr:PREDICTED: zinc finger FYVE domain-containing protein 26 [Ceratosolen solmsi marchali]